MATVKELTARVAELETLLEKTGPVEQIDTIVAKIKDLEAKYDNGMIELGERLELAGDVADTDEISAARSIMEKCRAPFPPEQIGKLPRKSCKDCSKWETCKRHSMVWGCSECGGNHTSGTIHLDYVGHAEITARLLAIDPLWTWEPVAWKEDGTPLASAKGEDVTLWIRLTVGGVTRLGVGSVKRDTHDVEKQLIGDALRNAAMRFGMGLELWSKSEHLEQTTVVDDPPKPDQVAETPAAAPAETVQNASSADSEAVESVPAAPEPETAPPAEEPARAQTGDGPPDHKTLEKVMLDLPPKMSLKVKKAFEAEGDLWPMANIVPERIADALVIIEELQAQNA